MLKLAIITSFLSQTKDRFHEYNEPLNLEEKFKLLSTIEGYNGVEIVYPYEVNDVQETRALLPSTTCRSRPSMSMSRRSLNFETAG